MDRGQISNEDGSFKSLSVKQNVYVRNKITTHCINSIKAEIGSIQTEQNVTIAQDLFVKGNTTLAGNLFVSGGTTLEKYLFVEGNTTLNSDLLVSGSATIQTNFYVDGDSRLEGELFVGQTATLNDDLFVSGNTTLQGDLLVQGGVSFDRSLFVSGNTTLHGGLLVQGDTSLGADLHVSGDTDMWGDLFVKGNTTLAGNLFVSGTASINNLAVSGAVTLQELKVLGDTTLCDHLTVTGDASLTANLQVDGQSNLHLLNVDSSATLGELAVIGNSTLTGDLVVQSNSRLVGDVYVGGNTTLAENLYVSGSSIFQGHVKALGDVSLCSDVDVAEQLTADRLKVIADATMCSDLWVAGSTRTNRIVPYSGITVSIGDVPGSVPKPVLATNILAVREIRGIGVGASVTIATSVNVLGKITATEAVISPLICASTTIGTGDSLVQANRFAQKTGATMNIGSPGVTITMKDDVIVRGKMLVDTILPNVANPTLTLGEPGDVVCINADTLFAKSIMNKPGMTMEFCSQKILTDKIVAKSGGSLTLLNPHAGMDIEMYYTNRGNFVMGALNNVARGGRSAVFAGQGLTATGEDSVVIGGINSRSHGIASAVLGGEDLKARGTRSVAVGGFNNLLTNSIEPFEFASRDSGIVAGRGHTITSEMGIILGGCNNRVDSAKGAILGGNNIRVCGFSDAAVGGGTLYSNSRNSAMLGGTDNTLFGADNSVICGGTGNKCSGMTNNMIIGGGVRNRITGRRSGTVGGMSLVVRAEDSVICGGTDNRIRKNKQRSFIGGGLSLVNFGTDAGMVGGCLNRVDEATCGFLGGGRSNTLRGTEGAICGGRMVRVSGIRSGSVGGNSNTIAGDSSVIIGGRNSRLSQMAPYSAMAGGSSNKLFQGENSFIAGGANHSITNGVGHAAIVAGEGSSVKGARGVAVGGQNLQLVSGTDSGLMSGFDNTVIGNNSVIIGGQTHSIDGNNDSVLGGIGHQITTNRSAVIGGNSHQIVESFNNTGFDNGCFVGNNNAITDGSQAVIAGGLNNVSTATDCFIGGSESCTATNLKCVIIGSVTSTAEGNQCAVFTSLGSKVQNGTRNVILGSENSKIETSQLLGNCVLGGGCLHKMIGTTDKSALFGGMSHTMNNSQQCVVIGGQRTQMRGLDNVVLGGQDLRIKSSEVEVSALIAGRRNRISSDQEESAIVVGRDCTIEDNSRTNFIGGAESAIIRLGSLRSGILSGQRQTILGSSNSDIIGGKDNLIDRSNNTVLLAGCEQEAADSDVIVMVGGIENTIDNSGNTSGNVIVGGTNSHLDGGEGNLVMVGAVNSTVDGETSRNVRVIGENIDITESQNVLAFGNNHTSTDSSDIFLTGTNNTVNRSDQIYAIGENINATSNTSNAVGLGTNLDFVREASNAIAVGNDVEIGGHNVIAMNVDPSNTLVVDMDNTIHLSAGCDGSLKFTGLTNLRGCPSSDDCNDFENAFLLTLGGDGETNRHGMAIMVDGTGNVGSDDPGYKNSFIAFFDQDGNSLGAITGETPLELTTQNPVYIEYIVETALWGTFNTIRYQYSRCLGGCVVADSCVAACENNIGTPLLIAEEAANLALLLFWIAYLQITRGVSYGSGSCDYAEYVPKYYPEEIILPGSVVGIKNGMVTQKTSECDGCQFFIISTSPIIKGNMPEQETDIVNMALVAMLGQVKSRVVGPVKLGDYLIPSGKQDGSSRAVSPADIQPSQLSQVLGVVWEVESSVFDYTIVNVAVGMHMNIAGQHIQKLESRVTKLERQMEQLLSGEVGVSSTSRDVSPEESNDGDNVDNMDDAPSVTFTQEDVEKVNLIMKTQVMAAVKPVWEKAMHDSRVEIEAKKPEIMELAAAKYDQHGYNTFYELMMDMNGTRDRVLESIQDKIEASVEAKLSAVIARKIEETPEIIQFLLNQDQNE